MAESGLVKSSERFFALFASGKRSELFTSPNISTP